MTPRGLLRRFAPRNDEKVAESGAFDDDAIRKSNNPRECLQNAYL
jgi:hypothetical protein